MFEKKDMNLEEIIKYVNGKNNNLDRVAMLMVVTVTAIMIGARPEVAAASTAFTILGQSVAPEITNILGLINKKDEDDKALEVIERCRFTELFLLRKAVKYTIEENLNGKDGFFVRWKISNLIEEEDTKRIKELDEKREEKYINKFSNRNQCNKDEYWDELINAITEVMDLKEDQIQEFTCQFKTEIAENYEAFKNQVLNKSEIFKNYLFSINNNSLDNLNGRMIKLEEFINQYGKLYMTIDEMDIQIKECTDPSISLNFFNYEDSNFVDQFIGQLNNDVIYVKGKTREEVIFYVLYIIRNIEKSHERDTYIIDSIDNWEKLKGKCENKVLVPNFNATTVKIIPGNINIVAYSDEDYIGNKEPIILEKRILSNMHEMLRNEVDNLDIVNNIVNKSKGLYSIFKRLVFKGKMGTPKWYVNANHSLIPALLIGQWTESEADIELFKKLAKCEYSEYMNSIKKLTTLDDPFLLFVDTRVDKSYKIANVEEAWEILLNCINEEDIKIFKDLSIEVLGDVPPKFNLDIEEHYKADVIGEKSKYSNSVKKGIITSLIMISNMKEGKDGFIISSPQSWVDDIIRNVFDQIKTSKQWFAISEHIDDIIEASPEVILTMIEKEILNTKSSFWDLFEKKSNSYLGSFNYYTHILWALEKILCLEEYVPQTIRILSKLSERDCHYNITNSPMSTLVQALSVWLHEINISLEDKVRLTKVIVKNSENGWELIEKLLPDRTPGKCFMSMSKPRYKQYRFMYKIQNQHEILDMYKEYTLIAIECASNDLSKWVTLFKKNFFFELGLGEEVMTGIQNAILACDSDKEKFSFKEEIRELIYKHRFFKDAKWSLSENYVLMIKQEVFDKIIFKNKIYNYLHLFIKDMPNSINPAPYEEKNYDENKYREERMQVLKLRTKAIESINVSQNFNIDDLLKIMPNDRECYYGFVAIGEIVASKLHNYNVDNQFVGKMIEYNKDITLLSYLNTIYKEKGLTVIKEVIDKSNLNNDIKISLLETLDLDNDFFEYLKNSDESIIEQYWKKFIYRQHYLNNETKNILWTNLINYCNYSNAIDILFDYFEDDIEKHIQLLEAIMKSPNEYRVNSNDSYYIQKSFRKIYDAQNLHDDIANKLYKLEWYYFNIISEITPKYIGNELKFNPKLLAELISYIYKRSDETTANSEITEEKRNLAEQAYNVMYKMKFCPCTDEERNISTEKIREWVRDFLRIVDQNKQSVIGRQILGECLAQSPLGSDGNFPHESVRTVFEENYSKEIEKGFITGVLNKRGVYESSNGIEEQKLSDIYQKYANSIRIEYNKMANALMKISKIYNSDSVLERKRATNEL